MTASSAPAVALVPVRDREFDALFAMFEEYCVEAEAFDPLGGPAQSSDERRAALLEGAEDEQWEWIEVDGERAGFLMSEVYEDDPLPAERTAEILECYVAPAFRRRGVGRAAVDAWLAAERSAGTSLVEAGVLRDNEGARAFWAAMGFLERSVQLARRP
jgi:ribosomal protein S18 acetylase RimI-like enzyme